MNINILKKSMKKIFLLATLLTTAASTSPALAAYHGGFFSRNNDYPDLDYNYLNTTINDENYDFDPRYISPYEDRLTMFDGDGATMFIAADYVNIQFIDAADNADIRGYNRVSRNIDRYDYGPYLSNRYGDIDSYRRVRYNDLYPGIDLNLSDTNRGLRYDYRFDAGADPNRVMMDFRNADNILVDNDGNLVVVLGDLYIVLPPLDMYQRDGGRRRSVDSRYEVYDGNRVGLRTADYDRDRKIYSKPVASRYYTADDYRKKYDDQGRDKYYDRLYSNTTRSTAVSRDATVSRSAAAITTVTMANSTFNPGSFDVIAGDQITWVNNDRIDHTITAENGSFDSGIVRPGESYAYTFKKSGTYFYYCALHPEMRGVIAAYDKGTPRSKYNPW